MAYDETRPWRWRNCRSLTVNVALIPAPWDWRIRAGTVRSDYLGWDGFLQFGPIGFSVNADHGNISTGDWRAKFGMSESEAWERSGP